MAKEILWFLIGMNGMMIIVNAVNLWDISRLQKKVRLNLAASEDILNGLKLLQTEPTE